MEYVYDVLGSGEKKAIYKEERISFLDVYIYIYKDIHRKKE